MLYTAFYMYPCLLPLFLLTHACQHTTHASVVYLDYLFIYLPILYLFENRSIYLAMHIYLH